MHEFYDSSVMLAWFVYPYRSFAKIRPPFLHRTLRNERGVGVIIGPPHAQTIALRQLWLQTMYNHGANEESIKISTTCWCFFDKETLCKINSRYRYRLEIRGKGLVPTLLLLFCWCRLPWTGFFKATTNFSLYFCTRWYWSAQLGTEHAQCC